MTVATSNDLVTTEQLMAMPEDGKERWLIQGELREKEITKRNRGHSQSPSARRSRIAHSCACAVELIVALYGRAAIRGR